ncbi:MAG: aldose 1-epimerase family protein, partial [Rikenellaceae bacterium]
MATIDNDVIRLQVSTLGAEMQSIVKHSTGREYLWQGDPTYWKYRASVLFPIVGAVCDNKYRLSGEEYNMTIHGIARDYDFEIVKHNQEEVVFKLVSTEEMKAKYPCDFVLEIGYKLVGDNVRVSYRVVNPSDETIHFQLGSHPGFNYRGYDETADVQGYIMFNDREADDKMSVSISNKDGFIVKKRGVIKLSEKMFPIMKSTFNRDALLFEGNQSKDIYLLDADKKPYVRVRHDSPVVGVWSKAYNGYAPFICIESLYGRCDDVNYKGAFEDKAWMQS